MANQDHNNQREFVRVPDASEVTYTVLATKQKKKNQVKNVSQTGICFVSEEDFTPGTMIDISIALESAEFSFTAQGIVRWSKEVVKNHRYEVGIKFEDLPEIDMKKLINYIQAAKRMKGYV
jgi:c-di-GMP-binding flagellar brake protein YcgR